MSPASRWSPSCTVRSPRGAAPPGPLLAAVLAAVLAAACGPADSPAASSPATTSTPASTLVPSVDGSADAIASSRPTDAPGLALTDPGRPFDADAIRAILDASRRPDPVPAEAYAPAVLAALAEAIWTIDGRPWQTADAGGTCGERTCHLELAGTREGSLADDLWVVEIDRATMAVEVVSTVLGAVPAELGRELDGLARDIVPGSTLGDAVLTGVRWLAPPDAGQFVLGYRTAGGSNGCGIDVTLDAATADLIDLSARDC